MWLKLLCCLAVTPASAEERILVIDTGFSDPLIKVNLCSTGHYDFTTNKPAIGIDRERHGTNVAEILANIPNTCIVIYKVWPGNGEGYLKLLPKALRKLEQSGIKYVNLSIVGNAPFIPEQEMFTKLKKVKVFVPAGNDGLDLDKDCSSYPACYKLPNVYVTGSKEPFSNFGSVVKYFEDPRWNKGKGTSYASPKTLRKIYERDVNNSNSSDQQQRVLQRPIPGSTQDQLQSIVHSIRVRCGNDTGGRCSVTGNK